MVLKIEDDYDLHMQPLDGTFPEGMKSIGGPRGSCGADTGNPPDVEKANPDAHVIFSNLKFGELGSTFDGTPIKPGPTPPGPVPSDCPGGSLQACIDLCPTDPPALW